MLKVDEWTIHKSSIRISDTLLRRFKQGVFRSSIETLNRIHRDTTSLQSQWAYDQASFTTEIIWAMNRVLSRFGFILSEKYKDSNVLICYRDVTEHSDYLIHWKNWKPDFHVSDQSLTFIPIYWHSWASFYLLGDSWKDTIPIEDWSIITFDHNFKHKVDFPPWIYTGRLKFWLSFFLDSLEKEKPTL